MPNREFELHHALGRPVAASQENSIGNQTGALRRGEYVEFPFGYLRAEKRVSQRWEARGDEPMRPYFIVHLLDEAGERLLEGEPPPAWPPGWSRKVDKRSLAYLWDRALRQDIKEAASRAKTARRRSGK